MKQFFRGVCVLALIFVFPHSAGSALEEPTTQVKAFSSKSPFIVSKTIPNVNRVLSTTTSSVPRAENVVITPINNGFDITWAYPAGTDSIAYGASTYTRGVGGSYEFFVKYGNAFYPETHGTITEIKKGAPYNVEVDACHPPEGIGLYICDTNPKEVILNSEVLTESTVTGSIYHPYNTAVIRLNVFPKDTANSWPVRARTNYDPLKPNDFPKNGVATATVYAMPTGKASTTKTVSVPWNIQNKSYTEYTFKPTEKGMYIVYLSVKLDKGFTYTYKVPGTGTWTYKYVRGARGDRTNRIRVWVPARYQTTDTVTTRKVFLAN